MLEKLRKWLMKNEDSDYYVIVDREVLCKFLDLTRTCMPHPDDMDEFLQNKARLYEKCKEEE